MERQRNIKDRKREVGWVGGCEDSEDGEEWKGKWRKGRSMEKRETETERETERQLSDYGV